MTRKFGRELKEGHTIVVGYSNRDRIISLTPYIGSLAHIFPEGAQIAAFALSNVGMTIENGALYDVVE
jgi:hypothetical protein